MSGSSGGWIAYDLDGTLAEWGPGLNEDVRRIGRPIPKMVARVKADIAAGREVRIFTARVAIILGAPVEPYQALGCASNEVFAACQRTLIQAWCAEHLGAILPVTAQKDFEMVACYDDRCLQVEPNAGTLREETLGSLVDHLVGASVAAWAALGYPPGSHAGCDLAEAIRAALEARDLRRRS